MHLSEADLNDLKYAKALLENPGLAAKITHQFGTPIEKGFKMLPAEVTKGIVGVTQDALSKAMDAAVFTLRDVPHQASSDVAHKFMVGAAGGVGGFFGLAALAVELPVSTTIMLRSIADIARSEGEAISTAEAQLACMEVFALGGTSSKDDQSESGYFAIRAALAHAVSVSAKHVAQFGLSGQVGAPVLVRLISQIAQRFSLHVSHKVAAQAVPVLGAAGGALVNTLFIDHFQSMARGHFIVRRLERAHGKAVVEAAYQALSPG